MKQRKRKATSDKGIFYLRENKLAKQRVIPYIYCNISDYNEGGSKRPAFFIGKNKTKEDMKATPLESKIARYTDPVIEDLGYAPFCVKVTGEGGAHTVLIMAEDPTTKRLGVDDCAKISRAVSAVLDVEDPISGAYSLQVSSPGIDRMLLKLEDFVAYTGFDAKVETDTPAENGQRKFRGIIQSVEDTKITLNTDEGEADIDFNTVVKAKLVMNDDLIKATANI